MGFDPRKVDGLSLWEINVAWTGYVQSQGGDVDEALTDSEIEEISEWLDQD